jgi:hypothetical protein
MKFRITAPCRSVRGSLASACWVGPNSLLNVLDSTRQARRARARDAGFLNAEFSAISRCFSMTYSVMPSWREDLARISQIVHRAQINASTNQPKS